MKDKIYENRKRHRYYLLDLVYQNDIIIHQIGKHY